MFEIKSYLAEKSALIDKALKKRLPAENTRPAVFHRAMRYSVLAGGKRLRPILCLAAAKAVGGKEKNALIPALAIELLHTYTLIHDDLPCMDNDDLRRGKPTCHIVFGEANAVLAGDALLTLAFEWLAGITPPKPYAPNQLILELARSASSRGVIGGQVEDLAAEGKKPDAAAVKFIHLHKTAALIRAAVRIGAICGGAGKSELSALSNYGEKAGLAFQIADDILNETSSPESLGKAAGSDRARAKMTYVSLYGLERAEKMAHRLTKEASYSLKALKGNTQPLAALVEYIVERKS
jgi:geranylgeranyl diphosphate synthase type II